MRVMALTCLFAIALSTVTFAADVSGAGPALVKERCERCHTLVRVSRYVEKKPGVAWWDKTLTRMQGHGVKLSSEEKSLLTGYLATQATAKDF